MNATIPDDSIVELRFAAGAALRRLTFAVHGFETEQLTTWLRDVLREPATAAPLLEALGDENARRRLKIRMADFPEPIRKARPLAFLRDRVDVPGPLPSDIPSATIEDPPPILQDALIDRGGWKSSASSVAPELSACRALGDAWSRNVEDCRDPVALLAVAVLRRVSAELALDIVGREIVHHPFATSLLLEGHGNPGLVRAFRTVSFAAARGDIPTEEASVHAAAMLEAFGSLSDGVRASVFAAVGMLVAARGLPDPEAALFLAGRAISTVATGPGRRGRMENESWKTAICAGLRALLCYWASAGVSSSP